MTEYVRVPREPTPEMVRAGCAVTCVECFADCKSSDAATIYRAMLAASPQGESSSADSAPIKPSSDTGELREKMKRAIWTQLPQEDANMGTSGRIADAILDLIQSERGKAVPMTAQDLADHAADAFDNALPDDALPHEVGRAWKAVGERLAAILAERAAE